MVAKATLAALAFTVAFTVACDDGSDPFADLIQVSTRNPFDACGGGGGQVFHHAEVEPFVAVDPTDPEHLIGVWQQDRWSNGGARGNVTAVSSDGGLTWEETFAHFSLCAGGTAANGADYQRATDPWVTFTPDGVAHQIAVAFDASLPRNAILVSRSDDGLVWDEPIALVAEEDADSFNDKCAITADPTDATRVYAVWDRVTGLLDPMAPIGTGPTYFARLTGDVWEPARVIYDPGIDNQTLGNVIVVLPDGTLVNVFNELHAISTETPTREVVVIRSTDHGDTWSAPILVSTLEAVGVGDGSGGFVRSGAELVSIAADPSSGALYVVWEDGRFSQGAVEGIAMAASGDGGLTWSAPAQINQAPFAPAFLPAVAVGPDGTVAVTYDDLREDDPDDRGSLMTTAWIITSRDGGATWAEQPLTGPFDLKEAKLGEFYFLGDYQGLAARGDGFVPFFAAARGEGNPTDVFTTYTGTGAPRRN